MLNGSTTLNGKILPESSNYTGGVSFLAKFDFAGHLLWMDTSHIFSFGDIQINKNGDCFILGGCPNTGGSLYGVPMPPDTAAWFIAKFNENGKIIWARKYSNNNFNFSTSAFSKMDQEENMYIFGSLPLYPDYFKIGTSEFYTVHNSRLNDFIAKFDSSGKLVWLTKMYNIFSFDMDSSQNVYVTATDSSIKQFNGQYSLYKLNRAGKPVKEISLDTMEYSSEFFELCTDGADHVYVSGTLSDTSKFLGQPNGGEPVLFYARLDTNLNLKWIRYLSGMSGAESPLFCNTKNRALYVNGTYPYKVSLGGFSTHNAPGDTFTRLSYYNGFFAKIDSAGHVLWLKNTTYSYIPNSLGITADPCDNFYAHFNYWQQLNFSGFHNVNPGKNWSSALMRFSSDSISYINQNATCGLSLKNTSNPIFTHFQWYAKDVGDTSIGKLIATTRDLNYLFPYKHKYIITLLAIKSGGCTNTVQDTFTVAGSPVAGYAAIDTQGCQYVQFLFSDTSHADTINSAVGQNWYWDFGDGSAPLTYSQTKRPVVSHVYTQSGVYTVTLVYGNGLCSDTFVSQKKVVIILAPKPGFSVSDTVGCVPLNINVTDGSAGQVSKWVYVVRKVIPLPPSKGDSLLSPSFGYSFSSPGIYIVHQYLTGPTGCVTEDSVMVNVTPVFSIADFTDVSDVTVDTNNVVEIKWLPYPGAFNYNLYRYTDYDTSTSTLLAQTNSTVYQDNSIDASKHSYSYYIEAQDGCGHFTSHGRIGKTIRLSGFENGEMLSQLYWTGYKNWPGGVSGYQIWRQDPGNGFKYLGNTIDTSYEDLQTPDIYGECYRVMATSNDTGLVSFSNVFCFSNSPQIFIPDIFTPNGDTLNDVFAPVCMGIKQWDMTIINRWDEKVYVSTSPRPSPGGEGESGWNGTFKGIVCPNGVYVYYIKATDFDGNTIVRQGKIMLQR